MFLHMPAPLALWLPACVPLVIAFSYGGLTTLPHRMKALFPGTAYYNKEHSIIIRCNCLMHLDTIY